MAKLRQEEEALEEDALAWLKANRGFEEAFHRSSDKNARFDAIGNLNGRQHFVEAKVSVVPTTTDEIESKISAALSVHGALSEDNSKFATLLRSFWVPDTVPVIAVMAGNYTTNGEKRLVEMLNARAAEWEFDWSLWCWNGDALETIAENISRAGLSRKPNLTIEPIPSPSSKALRKKATIDDVLERARELEIEEHVVGLIEAGKKEGFTPKPTSNGMSFYFRNDSWMNFDLDGLSSENGIEFRYPECCEQEIERLPVELLGRAHFNWLGARAEDLETVTKAVHIVGKFVSK